MPEEGEGDGPAGETGVHDQGRGPPQDHRQPPGAPLGQQPRVPWGQTAAAAAPTTTMATTTSPSPVTPNITATTGNSFLPSPAVIDTVVQNGNTIGAVMMATGVAEMHGL